MATTIITFEDVQALEAKEEQEESILAMLGIIGTFLNLFVIVFVYIYTTVWSGETAPAPPPKRKTSARPTVSKKWTESRGEDDELRHTCLGEVEFFTGGGGGHTSWFLVWTGSEATSQEDSREL